MNQWIKRTIYVLLLLVVGVGGFFVGRVGNNDNNENNLSTQIADTSQNRDVKIAMVSHDVGVKDGDKKINYYTILANRLSRTYGSNIETVSSEDAAKMGLKNGTYDAVVTFTSNFSQNVASFDSSTPQKGQVYYEVSDKVKDARKETVTEKVLAVTNSLNETLSYQFVSGAMKEFTEVQNKSKELLSNDQKDKQAISSIKPYNFIEAINITALKELKLDVKDLDLSKDFEENVKNINGLENLYKKYLGDTKSSHSALVKNMKDELKTLKGNASGAYENITNENGIVAKANKVGSTTYTKKEKDFIKALDDNILDQDMNSLENQQKEMKAINYYLEQRVASDEKDVVVDAMGGYFDIVSNRFTYGENTIESFSSYVATFGLDLDTITDVDNIDGTIIGRYNELNISINKEINDLDTAIENTKTEYGKYTTEDSNGDKDGPLASFVEKLKKQINEGLENPEQNIKNVDAASKQLEDYDPTAEVTNNQSTIDEQVNKYSTKGSQIEQSVTSWKGTVNEQMTLNFNLYSKNIQTIQKGITTTQKKADNKIKTAVSNVIKEKTKHSDVNQKNLERFTQLLPSLRVGTNPNPIVFDFMTKPLTVHRVEAGTTDIVKVDDVETTSQSQLRIFIIICAVIAAGLGGIIGYTTLKDRAARKKAQQ